MSMVKCVNCGKDIFVCTGVTVKKCEHCGKSLWEKEPKKAKYDHINCHHEWVIDDVDTHMSPCAWHCPLCHSTKRIIKGICQYWDCDGNQYTYTASPSEGEEALVYVEKQLEELRRNGRNR